MIRKAVKKWVDFMIRSGAPEEEREVYEYGLECTLNELVSDLILMAAAVLLHRVWQMILWIVVFNVLRVHVGGYHARTPAGCLIGSTLTGIVCVLAYPLLLHRRICIAFAMAACCLIIWRIAPVTHLNHPVTEARLRRVGKRARVLGGLLSLFAVAAAERLPQSAALVCMTCFVTCLLALIANSCTKKANS